MQQLRLHVDRKFWLAARQDMDIAGCRGLEFIVYMIPLPKESQEESARGLWPRELATFHTLSLEQKLKKLKK